MKFSLLCKIVEGVSTIGSRSMPGVSAIFKFFCTSECCEEGFFSRWTMAKDRTILLRAMNGYRRLRT